MKTHSNAIVIVAAMFLTLTPQLSSWAQSTAFTYQGRLNEGANPANGSYDLKFTVFDALSGGNPQAGTLTNSPTAVSNGLFTVTLDFGAGVFTGADRWLEIGVRTNGGGAFTFVSPRQALTPAPYALYAASAGTATTAGNALTVAAGSVGTVGLAVGAVDGSRIADGAITTAKVNSIDASKIVGGDLQAARLKVGTSHTLTGSYATIAGGEGNLAGGAQSAVGGGAANQALGGQSVVAGGSGNLAYNPGTFVGGGNNNTALYYNTAVMGGYGNMAGQNYSTIGGGLQNTNQSLGGFIGGGYTNYAEGRHVTVGGGALGRARSDFATIGGGLGNLIGPNAPSATIAGGENNANMSIRSTIGGGGLNTIDQASRESVLAGGSMNSIASNAPFSTLGGGRENSIGANCGTIPGGASNGVYGSLSLAAGYRAKAYHAGSFVWADATDADFVSTATNQFNVRAIGGVRFETGGAGLLVDGQPLGVTASGAFGMGTSSNQPLVLFVNGSAALRLEPNTNGAPNVIAGSPYNYVASGVVGATIGGGGAANFEGFAATNRVTADFGSVGGGANNVATGPFAVIGGGRNNIVTSEYGTVGGGQDNKVLWDSSTVGGGWANTAIGRLCTVAGGQDNTAADVASTVGGGWGNTSYGGASTIAGGQFNTASGLSATVGGGGNNTSSGYYATVSGGDYNTSSGYLATMGGGGNNTSSGYYATVSGGFNNTNSGLGATVPGGFYNLAAGGYSFAAGLRAKANHTGAFVWADSTDADFTSTATNQFNVRASGGARFETGGAGLTVDGQPLGVTAGGAFGLGTSGNQPLVFSVSGTPALRLEPTAGGPNLVAGFNGNWVLPGITSATIAGGGQNGSTNRVTALGGTVGGGLNNAVSNYNGTVGGGANNTASGNASSVSGGSENLASGDHAVIGGGQNNTSSGEAATVPGGTYNLANGIYSFAAGHRAKANHGGAFVWADAQDTEFASTAANQFLVRASGGARFETAGAGMTVASASGFGSPQLLLQQTDPSDWTRLRLQSSGPAWDIALGAGLQPVLNFYNGSAPVLALAQNGDATLNRNLVFSTGTLRQMLDLWAGEHGIGVQAWTTYFRTIGGGANGGFAWYKGGVHADNQFDAGGGEQLMRLTSGGLWVTGAIVPTSDRNAKTNFAPVNPREVLDKVAALPISTWNFRDDPATPHLGPVAQDFYAAFNVGPDDKHIATVDADGVALAAIQGLNDKVESGKEKAESRMEKLEAENAELKARLARLERLLENHSANR